MRVGNDYVIDVERMVFDKPHGLLITGAPYDEVWTLPRIRKHLRAVFRNRLSRAGAPDAAPVEPAGARPRARAHAGHDAVRLQPGRRKWRVGIFEPNICMVKTCFTPMLACDVAHRAHPRLIEHLWVYNSFHLKDKAAFVGFAQSLDVVRHGLASFEGRFPLFQVMPAHVDAVMAHHWENSQNYLYYEALHGGFPLVHNSHLLGDCGYRYQRLRLRGGWPRAAAGLCGA